MRVPPTGSRPIQHTESSTLNSGAAISKKQFEQQVSQTGAKAKAKLAPAADIISDVKILANQVRSGEVTKEEASKRFVALVLEKRHDLAGLGPRGKQIEEAIKEIAGDDPNFVSRLNTQFQRLS